MQVKKTGELISVAEQEIDFIGQLFVEYEQLAAYSDILTSPDKIRSLASLFYDFVDRAKHVISLGQEQNLWTSGPFGETDLPAGFFSGETSHRMKPFIRFYKDYKKSYPENISSGQVRELFYRFPQATEFLAADFRGLIRHLEEKPAH